MEKYELCGAQGIIFDKERNEIVLVKRIRDGYWVIPGGAIEEGETPQEAAVREVREETGLNVEIVALTGIYRRPNHEAYGKRGDETLVFLCREIGGEFLVNDEISEIGRFNLEFIPDLLIPRHRQRIEDAVNYIGEAVIKYQ